MSGRRGILALGLSLVAAGLFAGAVAALPSLGPSDGHLACDAGGGVWDGVAGVCRETDSPLSGAAL